MMRVTVFLFAAVFTIAACRDQTSKGDAPARPKAEIAKDAAARVEDAGPPTPPTPPTPPEAVDDSPLYADGARRVTLERLCRGQVTAARPLSTRSMSLKVRLDNGAVAVFKPMRRGNGSARCEVAYFKIARHLGVDGVPPSVMRELSAARLSALLRGGFEEIANEFEGAVSISRGGAVRGAMIAWVEGVGPSGFEGSKGRARLRTLLAVGGPRVEEEPLVAAASSMVVLDYVLGNWDRYSGGNLFADVASRLVLIDNNAAFAPWSEGQRTRSVDALMSCERFLRKLVERLAGLTRRDLGSALGRDDGCGESGALLTSAELERLLARRDELLARVRALVEVHGEAAVLFDQPEGVDAGPAAPRR